MSKGNKGLPIPVRFSPEEEALLNATSKRTGLSKSELIRRAVHLLNFEIQRRGGKVGWIADDLGGPVILFDTPAGAGPPAQDIAIQPGEKIIVSAKNYEAERLESLRVAEEARTVEHAPKKAPRNPP